MVRMSRTSSWRVTNPASASFATAVDTVESPTPRHCESAVVRVASPSSSRSMMRYCKGVMAHSSAREWATDLARMSIMAK